jgi:hypothetical protein
MAVLVSSSTGGGVGGDRSDQSVSELVSPLPVPELAARWCLLPLDCCASLSSCNGSGSEWEEELTTTSELLPNLA